MKIKICGIKRTQDIKVLNKLKPDYVGFVFAKSKRQVSIEKAKLLRENLDKQIKTVGVFVNHNQGEVEKLIEEKIIDIVQFHGDENELDIIRIKSKFPRIKIIKAVSVKTKEDILKWENSSADYLLLDNGKGGTGEQFDWNVLSEINIKKDFFIAGGLNPENVTYVFKHNPFGVDVSGGVETDNIKDEVKIKKFIEKVREYNE